jgi:Na+/serine symporter
MEKQSIPKQIAIGAFFGILLAIINQLKDPNPEPLLSAGGLGLLFGGAVAGVFLYMVLYRFWPRNK